MGLLMFADTINNHPLFFSCKESKGFAQRTAKKIGEKNLCILYLFSFALFAWLFP
jgi:hypothetical protein